MGWVGDTVRLYTVTTVHTLFNAQKFIWNLTNSYLCNNPVDKKIMNNNQILSTLKIMKKMGPPGH